MALETDWVAQAGAPKPRLEYQENGSFLNKQTGDKGNWLFFHQTDFLDPWLVSSCERVALEKDWVVQVGTPKPSLEYQGEWQLPVQAAWGKEKTTVGEFQQSCDRVALGKDWAAQARTPKPRLEYQGSDSFPNKQTEVKEESGCFSTKQIV